MRFMLCRLCNRLIDTDLEPHSKQDNKWYHTKCTEVRDARLAADKDQQAQDGSQDPREHAHT